MTNIHTLTIQYPENPCINCGACCAYFRVSFYWAESTEGDGSVPTELVEKVTPFISCMKGTNQKNQIRCVALDGVIGECVSCSIYTQRSTTCREFDASWENGAHNEACDRARAAYNLPPLQPADPTKIAC